MKRSMQIFQGSTPRPPRKIHAQPNAARSRGMTLIEILVAVMVGAMLLIMAVPALNAFVLSDRDTGQVNSLVSSFNYARSEAVRRNTLYGIEVCPSTDSQTCSPTAAWSQGWIVLDLDPADTYPNNVLLSIPAFAGANAVTASSLGGITFTGFGALSGGASLMITVCDTRGAANARDVQVNSIGSTQASQKPGYQVNGTTPLVCP
jgi:type IV fimbrial biogenesis protein FimT